MVRAAEIIFVTVCFSLGIGLLAYGCAARLGVW